MEYPSLKRVSEAMIAKSAPLTPSTVLRTNQHSREISVKKALALKGFAAHSIEGAPQLTAHVHVHLHVGDGVCPRPFKKDELEKHSKEAEAEAKGCSSIACWTRTGLGTLPARNWHLPSVLGVWVERHDKG